MLHANIAGRGFCEIPWSDGRLDEIRLLGPEDPAEPYCSPGFIDLQVNGLAGVDFSSHQLTPEAVIATLRPLWASGVTTFCPTVLTNSRAALLRSFQTLEAARALSPEFDICAPCYHLEGPYLSSGDSRGAHDPRSMRAPDAAEFDQLQHAAGGRIGTVTLAPELPGAVPFIEHCTAAGVVCALGHTDGVAADIHRAAAAGAALCTHLGNGCPEFIHRHRSPLWAQLACETLAASLICDGFHLTPDFLRVAFGMKGRDRCILVTDSIHVAGLPPGRYQLAGLPVELHPSGKVASVENPGALAGSTLRMNRAIAVFRQQARVPLETALAAATINPARLLARWPVRASFAPGEPAKLVLFRPAPEELTILATYLEGRLVTP